MDQSEFLEYMMLDRGEPHLVTKSELLEQVKSQGLAISDRQLTFYVAQGLLPKSVRVGSRAGVYPQKVVSLLSWILRFREMGVPLEAIKELIPIWKYLTRCRNEGVLDVREFEYFARGNLTSLDSVVAVPDLVTSVFSKVICPDCRKRLNVQLVAKDGTKHSIEDPETTLGFAGITRRPDEDGNEKAHWFGYSRITLASPPEDWADDPTTVVLGIGTNELPPPSPYAVTHDDRAHGTGESLPDAVHEAEG